ncbi:MAG: carbon storage regulator [Planctomycetes bacterium]|nr:carbon storage regulator [Planctomycetota bacterium]
MLVLSRRAQDSIIITGSDGEKMTINVLSVEKNGTVRLGIDAPQQYKILRGELIAEVRDENKHAAAGIEALESLQQLNKLLPALQAKNTSVGKES